MGAHPISAVLADIDGTLVTKEKVLTERAIQAVGRLRERGIVFTICSSRSPRGMRKLVEPLHLTMPMAAFNGGVIVLPDLSVLDERAMPDYVVPAIVEAIRGPRPRRVDLQRDRLVRPFPSGPARRSRGVDQSVRAHGGGHLRRRPRAASSRSSASAMTTTRSPRVKRSFRRRSAPRSPLRGRSPTTLTSRTPRPTRAR